MIHFIQNDAARLLGQMHADEEAFANLDSLSQNITGSNRKRKAEVVDDGTSSSSKKQKQDSEFGIRLMSATDLEWNVNQHDRPEDRVPLMYTSSYDYFVKNWKGPANETEEAWNNLPLYSVRI